jgi:hypothetical protein
MPSDKCPTPEDVMKEYKRAQNAEEDRRKAVKDKHDSEVNETALKVGGGVAASILAGTTIAGWRSRRKEEKEAAKESGKSK